MAISNKHLEDMYAHQIPGLAMHFQLSLRGVAVIPENKVFCFKQ